LPAAFRRWCGWRAELGAIAFVAFLAISYLMVFEQA